MATVFEGQTHAEPIDADSVEEAIHLAMGSPPRVLVIDDRLPDSRLGSGYSRMFDVVREISTAGYRVSVFPTIGIVGDPDVLGAFGVGVVTEPLAEHLRRRSARYEVVIISRPHNYERYGSMVANCNPRRTSATTRRPCSIGVWKRRLSSPAQTLLARRCPTPLMKLGRSKPRWRVRSTRSFACPPTRRQRYARSAHASRS